MPFIIQILPWLRIEPPRNDRDSLGLHYPNPRPEAVSRMEIICTWPKWIVQKTRDGSVITCHNYNSNWWQQGRKGQDQNDFVSLLNTHGAIFRIVQLRNALVIQISRRLEAAWRLRCGCRWCHRGRIQRATVPPAEKDRLCPLASRRLHGCTQPRHGPGAGTVFFCVCNIYIYIDICR